MASFYGTRRVTMATLPAWVGLGTELFISNLGKKLNRLANDFNTALRTEADRINDSITAMQSPRNDALSEYSVDDLITELFIRQNKLVYISDELDRNFTDKNYDTLAQIIRRDENNRYFIKNMEEYLSVQNTEDKLSLAGAGANLIVASGMSVGINELNSALETGVTEGTVSPKMDKLLTNVIQPLTYITTLFAGVATYKSKWRQDATKAYYESKTNADDVGIQARLEAERHLDDDKKLMDEIQQFSSSETLQTEKDVREYVLKAIKQRKLCEKYEAYLVNRKSNINDIKNNLQRLITANDKKIVDTEKELTDFKKSIGIVEKRTTRLTDLLSGQQPQTIIPTEDQQKKIDEYNFDINEIREMNTELKKEISNANRDFGVLNKILEDKVHQKYIEFYTAFIAESLELYPSMLERADLSKLIKSETSKSYNSLKSRVKSSKLYQKVSSAASATRKRFENINPLDPLGIIPEEESYKPLSNSRGKSSGGSKTRKRRKTKKSTFRKGGAKY